MTAQKNYSRRKWNFRDVALVTFVVLLLIATLGLLYGPLVIKSLRSLYAPALSPVIFSELLNFLFTRSPNIIHFYTVPGTAGNQIDAKIDKPSSRHFYCTKKEDWFNLWLNLELLAPLVVDCWVDNSRLIYDNVTRLTRDPPGVVTRVPGWGNPEVVEWIDPTHIVISPDDSS